MEQNQYKYTRKIGNKTYTVIVRQAAGATEKIGNRVRKLLLNDLSEVG